ncbi:receptor-like protein 12, partial [Prunus avium]|uniref:Receptor-like protein 12 n=1 Tax=Prunus avium TaxID=42229 RepID=A0A6P5TU63_PRUAV
DCGLFGKFPARIFELQDLETLDVRSNQDLTGTLIYNFNYSQIPTTLGNFPQLTYLNLSASGFFGQVPSQLSQLSKLSNLDLSLNLDPFLGEGLLSIRESDLRSLIRNLTTLEKLHLSFINISSTIPDSIANLSFLTSLLLRDCGLFGKFPARIFELQDLETLDVRSNQDLTGYLPEFNRSSRLVSLKLGSSSISGNLSPIRNLDLLQELDVRACNFSGPIPDWFANLTQLTYLSLSDNNFSGGPLSWIGKQTKLTYLHLGNINLSGYIPSSLRNLTQLFFLHLPSNQLTGPIPSWLGNLSRLAYIDQPSILYYVISENKLTGEISPLICDLSALQFLDLSNNKLSGMLPQCLGDFSDDLRVLNVGNNSFHGVLPQAYTNTSKLKVLDVSSNQLQGKLPRSLANCAMLESLILSNNEFHDVFPSWLGTFPELKLLSMRHNGFYGVIGKQKRNLRFPELRILDLSHNNFRGEFPSEYIFTGNPMRGIPHGQPTYMDTYASFSVSGVRFYYAFSIMKVLIDTTQRFKKTLGSLISQATNLKGRFLNSLGT